jgi:hypothetical protein
LLEPGEERVAAGAPPVSDLDDAADATFARERVDSALAQA